MAKSNVTFGLIGNLNDALAVIRAMSTEQISSLVWNMEREGWYRENRRRTRSWCIEVAISNWYCDKHAVLRCIYNAE